MNNLSSAQTHTSQVFSRGIDFIGSRQYYISLFRVLPFEVEVDTRGEWKKYSKAFVRPHPRLMPVGIIAIRVTKFPQN